MGQLSAPKADSCGILEEGMVRARGCKGLGTLKECLLKTAPFRKSQEAQKAYRRPSQQHPVLNKGETHQSAPLAEELAAVNDHYGMKSQSCLGVCSHGGFPMCNQREGLTPMCIEVYSLN